MAAVILHEVVPNLNPCALYLENGPNSILP